MQRDFAFSDLFRSGLPQAVAPFSGLPRYNFVFGHNDPAQVPAEELAEVAARVLRAEGHRLGLVSRFYLR